MSSTDLDNFFSNLSDRSITVCEGCNEKGVLEHKRVSDLGFCFYRHHEGVYASETGTLYLTWGSYSTDEMIMLIIIEAIKDEAKACNIEFDWKGSLNDRVILKNLQRDYFNKF